jgi:Zn-dependent peptidase ImmA (M78 family)
MRYVPDKKGRFKERPHYDPKELDIEFERIVVDFLRSKNGVVIFPISTDDLTVLIERDTEDFDAYADLSEYGQGVEGVTEFRKDKKPVVKISKDLMNSDSHENRVRTTLTHEYGHVHLHGPLFAMEDKSPSLFDEPKKSDIIACKRETMINAPQVDWMEWQAGYACGAILMPATFVRKAVSEYRKSTGIYGAVPALSPEGQKMIELIMAAFQVSRDAARVRLSVLDVLGNAPAMASLAL